MLFVADLTLVIPPLSDSPNKDILYLYKENESNALQLLSSLLILIIAEVTFGNSIKKFILYCPCLSYPSLIPLVSHWQSHLDSNTKNI